MKELHYGVALFVYKAMSGEEHCVYIIYSESIDKYYVGKTTNVEARLIDLSQILHLG